MKNYLIEKMDLHNIEHYARVNALAWLQSYKGIVNNDFLELINTEEEIQKAIINLKSNLQDGSRRFLLKEDNQYIGILRTRRTKYEKYSQCGELGALYLLGNVKGNGFGKILFEKALEELKDMGYKSMIVGCLAENPANGFYKHMG
ncbi:MAG: GNAT family N-acetyltransferase, partial [Lachnospiraceae bacterium]|nr:GNAT family N-acetyltransferase [Lachnospiraceae bacterium]